jgi:hypothetical protein
VSSVACLNCICFLLEWCPRYFVPRYKGFNLDPYLIFWGGLSMVGKPTSARHRTRSEMRAKPDWKRS